MDIKAPKHIPILSIEEREAKFDRDNLPNLRVLNMKEEFRFIDDFTCPNIIPERYMVSNCGRVYDRVFNHYVDFIPDQEGYPSFIVNYYIDTYNIGSIAIRVCDAVLRTFDLIPEYKETTIRHLDGNKNHFSENNLEWFDPDSLPNHLVETICSRLQSGGAIKHLVEAFDIPKYVIEDIRDGKRYTHVRRKYKIEKKKMNVLLPAQVRLICDMLSKKQDVNDIAEMVHCPVKLVNNIRAGKAYTRISKDYDFERVFEPSDKSKPLTEEEVRYVCEILVRQPELNNYQISIICKCNPTQVRDIRLKKVYRDIVKDYNW